MPKISVIIPVFNSEKYLRECLDSVVDQTFKDIEIICVNDGSTDSSLQILEEYAQKDNRIKFFNQKNLGPAAARNAGFNVARGEYIQFIDADDILEKNALETSYNKITAANSDMVIFCHRRMINGSTKHNNLSSMRSYIDNPGDINLFLPFTNYVWDKLIKKEFLLKNNILFNKNIVVSEDGYYILTCLKNKPSIEYIQEILYTYRDAENSFTKRLNWTGHSVDTLLTLLNSEIFNDSDDDFKKLILCKYLNSIAYWYGAQQQRQYTRYNKKKIKKLIDKISNFVDSEDLKSKLDSLKFKIGYTKSFLHRIFSSESYYFNDSKYKLISILGIKIRLKVKYEKIITDNINKLCARKYDGIIMNYWWSLNYGASLTAYAIQQYLFDMGRDFKILNFKHSWARKRYIGSFSEKFAKKYLSLTPDVCTYNDFLCLNACTDNFIVGSDQVFRPRYTFGNLSRYLLAFTEFSKRRIAFSASFGTDYFDARTPLQSLFAKQALKRFDYISTREDSGVDICKNEFNIEAQHIIDPVFLLDKSKWEDLANNSTNDYKGTIVSYIFEKKDEANSFKNHIQASYKMPIVEFVDSGYSIEDFLKAFRDAEYIITDSFHGLCFALIFHKKFICIVNRERGVARFDSLINMFKIGGLFIDSFKEASKNKVIFNDYNYDFFEKVLVDEKIKAKNFMEKALYTPKVMSQDLIINEMNFLHDKV